MAFMRAYQRLSGDPFGIGQRLVPKRKNAGAGPRVKAFRKRSIRQLRLVRGQGVAGDPFLGMLAGPAAAAARAAIGPTMVGAGKAGSGLAGFLGNLLGGAKNVAASVAPHIGAVLKGGLPALANVKPMAGGGALPPIAAGLPDLGFVGGAARGGVPGFGGKRRTMNPANVKALKRAFRREEAFTKLAARVGYVPRSPIAKRATTRARRRKR